MVDVVGAVVKLTDVGADELGAEVLGVAVVGLTDVGEDVLGLMLGFEVVGLAVALTDVVVSELSGFEEGIGGGLVLFLSNIAAAIAIDATINITAIPSNKQTFVRFHQGTISPATDTAVSDSPPCSPIVVGT